MDAGFLSVPLSKDRPSRRRGVGRIAMILNVVVALGLAWIIFQLVGPSFSSTPVVGYPLSVLRLQPLLPGTPPVKLDDLKGKVTVINYWATWCPPCVEELPHLSSLARSYDGRRDFRLLSVATGHPTEPALREATAEFLRVRNENLLPVYFDPQEATRAGLQGVPPGVIPLTVVLDREAKVAKVIIGFTPAGFEEMKLLIASLLQAKAS